METGGLDRVAQQLARDLATAGRDVPTIRALGPGAVPHRTAAVDGSNATLAASGSHLVGALRIASVMIEGGSERIRPGGNAASEVVLLTTRDASATLSQRLGVDVGRVDLPGALELLRDHEEHALALRLLEELEAGDVLLLDGALAVRPPLTLMTRILDRAREGRIDVVGVCKSTGLTIGNVPAIAACALAARSTSPPREGWWAEIPAPPAVRARVLIARLSNAEDRPFRFDIASDRDPSAVLAALASLSRHPAQPGYPSPLAMAHHRATIQEVERRRLASAVRDAARERGVRDEAWRAAFLDWHDVLELGV